MITLFSSNPIWSLVNQSDWMSKFVLLVLLFLSVSCWAILFYKVIVWRIRKKQIKSALTFLKSAKNLDDVFYTASKFSNTLPGYLLTKKLSFLKTLLIHEKDHVLDEREWELLQGRINQLLDTVIIKEESYLPVLSVSGQIGPLLGLFGTIWGLVHAFVDISQRQSADIAVVAPGIAEALITTLAGLIVAIPALFMFTYLSLKLRDLDQQISNLAGRFMWLVQKNYTKKVDE
jgi:biopolymer transport protein TolQ